eukprot:gb/GEZN01004470.1/.p1 GENE.gb/GEZN01004470.1/~~gb/GEZN01004470.1/.p1  ORF type:complete len:576 (+),score=96.31 gb/GEZN01004470.1/:29-1756(+)
MALQPRRQSFEDLLIADDSSELSTVQTTAAPPGPGGATAARFATMYIPGLGSTNPAQPQATQTPAGLVSEGGVLGPKLESGKQSRPQETKQMGNPVAEGSQWTSGGTGVDQRLEDEPQSEREGCLCCCCEEESDCGRCCREDCSPPFQRLIGLLGLLWLVSLLLTVLCLRSYDPFVWTFHKNLLVLLCAFSLALMVLFWVPSRVLCRSGRRRRSRLRREQRERRAGDSSKVVWQEEAEAGEVNWANQKGKIYIVAVVTMLLAGAITVGASYRPLFQVDPAVLGPHSEGIAVVFVAPNVFINASKSDASPSLAQMYGLSTLKTRWNVLDVRSKGFEHGHLPGALHVPPEIFPLDTERFGGLLPDAEHLTHVFHEAGFDAALPSLVYGDWNYGQGQECYMYFILRYLGVTSVSVLYGGVWAWSSAGLQLEQGFYLPQALPGQVHLKSSDAVPMFLELRQDIQARIAQQEEQQKVPLLLDAREAKQFKDGHLPGATNLDWRATLEPDGNLLSHSSFMKYLSDRQLQGAMDNQTCTYSNLGVRGAWLWTILFWHGSQLPRLYLGGSEEWTAAGLTLETD